LPASCCDPSSAAALVDRFDNSVDCVVTRDFPRTAEAVACASAVLRRILRPTGVVWLIFDERRTSGACWRTAFALQEDGWLLRNALIVDQAPVTVGVKTVLLFAGAGRYYFHLGATRTPTRKNSGDVWSAVSVLEKCIAVGCPRDGVVADPFGMSADVSAAARRVGRRYTDFRLQVFPE